MDPTNHDYERFAPRNAGQAAFPVTLYRLTVPLGTIPFKVNLMTRCTRLDGKHGAVLFGRPTNELLSSHCACVTDY